ncbi:hypothetical protein UVI_02026910 [Ustilaginoidea virens]|uniref:Uncharacterized protein n=1 Tax=Ustilaginoidea virens TaxID=1159556 RepID=A0A1B5L388_USTVR|nr:hypothetical protein UVI_02026910 [Ustilaginoidea virens]
MYNDAANGEMHANAWQGRHLPDMYLFLGDARALSAECYAACAALCARALCSVRAPCSVFLCFVLCALCSVLCALCSVLCALWKGIDWM